MTSSDLVLEMLDLPITGAAVGAALELGLFWVLADGPCTSESLARRLGILSSRCEPLAALLASEGLIVETREGWALTEAARSTILGGYSMATWQFLAQEARERCRAVLDLPAALRAGPADPGTLPDYVEEMMRDPERARRFTRMLYEIHQPLARRLAVALELTGVGRLLDLGGGSGVVSLALVRRWPELAATVVDVASVCDAGREIAAEEGLADRVSYLPANFMAAELPAGFQAVLECDVAIYSVELFARVRRALADHGRFLVVDAFAEDGGGAGVAGARREHGRDRSELAWSLVRRLRDPSWRAPTVEGTVAMLREAGFKTITTTSLPSTPGVGGLSEATTVIDARPGG